MRVLIFSQYFSPEVGATQTRVHTFAAGLAHRGHDVDVVCEVPNHPQGIVHAGYEGRILRRRRVDGFTAWHVWVRTSRVKTMRTRLEFYGSYTVMASVFGSLAGRPDVVLASSPPLPVAVAAAVVARRFGVPWVLDVRDLWPEAAVAMGELSNERLLRLAERLERRLYASASGITAVTEPFRRAIEAKIGATEKVSVIPNGTTRFWVEGADLEVDRADVGLPDDRFVWTFAGNIGVAQGLEAAVAAAGRLGEGFHLLILGDGPARAALERRAAELSAPVEFRGQVQPTEARRILRASDALLVSLRADPVLEAFVPSKLFDCCAVGRPVVLAAAGEPWRLTEAAGATLNVPPGDPTALADAVRSLREGPALAASLATAARGFGAAHLRDGGVVALEERLSALMDGLSWLGRHPSLEW